MKIKARSLYRQKPLELPELEEDEVYAIEALHDGIATAEQQITAFNTIIKKFCGLGGIAFDADPYVHAMSEGKRVVGAQIIAVIETPHEKLFGKEPKND